MAGHTPVDPDPKELKKAELLWEQFITISKWSIALICVILLGLAFAFVPFA